MLDRHPSINQDREGVGDDEDAERGPEDDDELERLPDDRDVTAHGREATEHATERHNQTDYESQSDTVVSKRSRRHNHLMRLCEAGRTSRQPGTSATTEIGRTTVFRAIQLQNEKLLMDVNFVIDKSISVKEVQFPNVLPSLCIMRKLL